MSFFDKLQLGATKANEQLNLVLGTAREIETMFDRGQGLDIKVQSVVDTLAVAQGNVEVVNAGLEKVAAGGDTLSGMMLDLEGQMGGINASMGSVLSDFLKIDPRGKQQELQEMLRDIRSGQADWETFLGRISEGGNRIGQQLQAAVQAFKDQKLALVDFQRILDSIDEVAAEPDSALSNALHQLGQDARTGRLG